MNDNRRSGLLLLSVALAMIILAGGWISLVVAEERPTPGSPWVTTSQIPDPGVEILVGQVQSDTVRLYDGGLSGEWPIIVGGVPYTIETRNTYSGEPIQMATAYVGEHMEGLGLSVAYHFWQTNSVLSGTNVIGQLDGYRFPNDIYLVGAHLDNMPPSGAAPGADDNASGSTAVIIAADLLSQYQWPCTIRFAFFTGEEQGLRGSAVYAAESAAAGDDIRGVLNLDMIGWNTPDSPKTMEVHTRSTPAGNQVLVDLFLDVVDAYQLDLIPVLIPSGTGASDHASFWNNGYPAILAIEDYASPSDFNPYYHSSSDQLKYLDLDYFTEMVRAAVATMAHLAACENRGYLPVMFGGE